MTVLLLLLLGFGDGLLLLLQRALLGRIPCGLFHHGRGSVKKSKQPEDITGRV